MPPGSPSLCETNVPYQGSLKLFPVQGDRHTSELGGEIGGGPNDPALPIQESDCISEFRTQELGDAVWVPGLNGLKERSGQINFSSNLILLEVEKSLPNTPIYDKELPHHHEGDEGKRRGQEDSPNRQLSPSGTENR